MLLLKPELWLISINCIMRLQLFIQDSDPEKPLLLLAFVYARCLWTIFCNSWILTKSMWKTSNSTIKHIFLYTALVIRRARAFREPKFLIFLYNLPSIPPPKVVVWPACVPKDSLGHFSTQNGIWYGEPYMGTLRDFVAIETSLTNHEYTLWFIMDTSHPHRTAGVFHFCNKHFYDRVIAVYYL